MPEWSDELTIPNVKIVRKLAKSVIVSLDEDTTVLIPDSQISDNSEIWKVGQEGSITINRWLARQKDELKDYID